MKTSTLILLAAAGVAGFLYWRSMRPAAAAAAEAARPGPAAPPAVSVGNAAAAADPYLDAVRQLNEELKAIKK